MKTNWNLNDFHTGFLPPVQFKIVYLIRKHKRKLLHAFSRFTIRFTDKKPVILAAQGKENTRQLFCGRLMCFSVALFSDACNETQNFLWDKSTFQTPKLYSTHHVQPWERQQSERTANESFLRLLSCVEIELFVLHGKCTATPNLCIVWSLRAYKR